MDKRVVHKPNVLAAEAKGTASKQAFEAVTGDLRGLDLDYLDSLNRIQGKLKNEFVESLSASKITSGSILGTNLTLAGTEASNNKTTLTMIGDALLRVNDGTKDNIKLSNAGLQFLSTSSFQDTAQSNSASKITSTPGGSDNRVFSALGFALSENTFRRGMYGVAHGIANTAIDGLMRFATTASVSAAITDSTSAYIDIYSRSAVNGGRGRVDVAADLYAFQQFYALQYAEFRGNANMKGTLDVDLNTVLRSATTIQGATTLQAALNVSGLTTLGGVDAVNVRVSGQYNNTGVVATFGGGIVATGSVLASGGNLVGDGLNVRSGLVAMPANTIDGFMLQAHVSNNTLRAVGANHIRSLAVSADHLGDNAATLRVINSNLFNPAQNDYGLRNIGQLLGGTALNVASGNHAHNRHHPMIFTALARPERRRSLAQRLTLRRALERNKSSQKLPMGELEDLVFLLASQVQTLSHLVQDEPDRDAYEMERSIKDGAFDERSFEERNTEEAEEKECHIDDLPHAWHGKTHPDLVA